MKFSWETDLEAKIKCNKILKILNVDIEKIIWKGIFGVKGRYFKFE